MKRVFVNILAIALAASFWAPQIASAETGYQWTDISDQLTVRTNRPIWAMAYANGYWFYTDGQDLWSGGQVYRYDGTTQVTITADVRNAGLSRVDDIVSDGQSVLFLKNVVRLDNSFEILKWNSSGYVTVSSNVRNSLNSDEGISSITGRNGTWMIVTTKARLFTWNGGQANPVLITLPTELRNVPISDSMLYSTAQGFPSGVQVGRYHLGALPVAGNQWAIFGKSGNIGNQYALFRYDGVTFTKINESSGAFYSQISAAASNGNKVVFIIPYSGAHYGLVWVWEFDGYTLKSFYNFTSPTLASLTELSEHDQDSTLIGDGANWLLFNKKKTLLMNVDTGIQDMGSNRDFFITAAGDNNGHVLAGGAVSEMGISSPTSPLTAKLIKMTKGQITSTGTGSYGGGKTYTSANGPTIQTSGNPSDYRVGNGGTFVYRATATDGNGVDRIDLYVNGARIKTCNSGTCEFETQYFTNGVSTRAIPFSVRATDSVGYSTETATEYLTVDMNSNATAGTVTTTPTSSGTSGTTAASTALKDSGTGISSWTWLDPAGKSALNSGETVTWNVGAYDDNGIKRIEIIVNGTMKKTCELNSAKGNQSCAVPVYASDYPAGTSIFVNAKVTDGDGKYTYSTATSIARNTDAGSASTSGASTGSAVSAWSWFEPSGDLKRGATTNFRAGAWSQDGLATMELYVNGALKRTCTFNRAYGNQECSTLVYSNDYPVGTQIAANAKVTDVNGKSSWSNLSYVPVVDSTTVTSGTNNAPIVWDWIEIGMDFITVDEKAKYAAGSWDENGIASATIYVNGEAKQQCWFGTAYGNQFCSYEIMGSGYSVGSALFVNAKITDATGKESWTAGKSFKVMGSGTTTSVDYANNATVSSWSNKTSYGASESIYVSGSGSDPDGIQRMEIYANGDLIKTCWFSNVKYATCEATIGPFPNLPIATYAVTLFDRYGYETTTGYKQATIVK